MEHPLVTAVGGALEHSLAELLRQRLLNPQYVAAPAAGADWQVKVPNVAYWELLAVSYKLTTSAVVANRQVSLLVKDQNGVVLGEVDALAVQAAGATKQYVHQDDVAAPEQIVAITGAVPLAGVPLQPGWTIGTSTALIDAGDQYGSIVVLVREWTAEEIVRQGEWLRRHYPAPHE